MRGSKRNGLTVTESQVLDWAGTRERWADVGDWAAGRSWSPGRRLDTRSNDSGVEPALKNTNFSNPGKKVGGRHTLTASLLIAFR